MAEAISKSAGAIYEVVEAIYESAGAIFESAGAIYESAGAINKKEGGLSINWGFIETDLPETTQKLIHYDDRQVNWHSESDIERKSDRQSHG
jgi:hypothetical protein